MHTIVQDLLNHMAACGGTRNDWYVGIAADAQNCLFKRHGVDQKLDAWIYRCAANDNEARAIEQYFLSQGFDGGPGGGSVSTQFVYAFRKTVFTRR